MDCQSFLEREMTDKSTLTYSFALRTPSPFSMPLRGKSILMTKQNTQASLLVLSQHRTPVNLVGSWGGPCGHRLYWSEWGEPRQAKLGPKAFFHPIWNLRCEAQVTQESVYLRACDKSPADRPTSSQLAPSTEPIILRLRNVWKKRGLGLLTDAASPW